MICTENELKKWTLKAQKCSISAVFPIVRFAGDQKTALTGESLYIVVLKLTSLPKPNVRFDYTSKDTSSAYT